MNVETVILFLALIIGFYTAWNIGANDVSNAMGTSVGSKALTLKQAVVLAGLFEFCGAFFFGGPVSETLQRDIINPDAFHSGTITIAIGMLSSLLAAGIWLQLASYNGWPVSTTHSIIGAIVGFGCVAGGWQAIQWNTVFHIGLSWVLSPLSGAFISYFIFSFLRTKILYSAHPLTITKNLLPYIIFLLSLVLIFSLFYPADIDSESTSLFIVGSIVVSLIISLICSIVVNKASFALLQSQQTKCLLNKHAVKELEEAKAHLMKLQQATEGEMHYQVGTLLEEVEGLNYSIHNPLRHDHMHLEFQAVERIFGYLQICTACLMAFSHGANDVANAIGPLASIFSVLREGTLSTFTACPPWILALGATGIVIGLATWGWRVIETIGKKITELTPTRGFSAEFGASLTVLLASRLGLPISTTHTLVGAVFGVGLAGGIGTLNLITLRDILLSWIITIPAGALFSIICYSLLDVFF